MYAVMVSSGLRRSGAGVASWLVAAKMAAPIAGGRMSLRIQPEGLQALCRSQSSWYTGTVAPTGSIRRCCKPTAGSKAAQQQHGPWSMGMVPRGDGRLQHQQVRSLPPGVYRSTSRGLMIAEVHRRSAIASGRGSLNLGQVVSPRGDHVQVLVLQGVEEKGGEVSSMVKIKDKGILLFIALGLVVRS
jgi:hypothetical protein